MNVMRVVHGVYLHVAEMSQIPPIAHPERVEARPHIVENQQSWMTLTTGIEIALQGDALTVAKCLGRSELRRLGYLLSFNREGL